MMKYFSCFNKKLTQEEINSRRIRMLPFTHKNIDHNLLINNNNINKINEQRNEYKRFKN